MIEWSRDFEDEINRVAKEFARNNQPKMDAFTEQHKGRPVAEIKSAVQREMEGWGGSFSDDAELTRVATAISEGQQVILNPPA